MEPTPNLELNLLNDEAVEAILASYDDLARAVDDYERLLNKQMDESEPAEVTYRNRLKSSLGALKTIRWRLEESSGSFSDPDAGLFDALMELRHGQHHIRLARQGKMV